MEMLPKSYYEDRKIDLRSDTKNISHSCLSVSGFYLFYLLIYLLSGRLHFPSSYFGAAYDVDKRSLVCRHSELYINFPS